MKLIYAHGFSNSEKLDWKPVVFNNVVQSFQLIFEAMNEIGIGFENPENEASSPPPRPAGPHAGRHTLGRRQLSLAEEMGRIGRERAHWLTNNVTTVMSEPGH